MAGRVVIATGGLSYPGTGSTGDGYRMARETGHTVVSARPALVPLETEETFVKDLQGLSLENIELTAYGNNRELWLEIRGLLFTHLGFGPGGTETSGGIAECLDTKHDSYLSVNFKPALEKTKVERPAAAGIRRQPAKTPHINSVMKHLLPLNYPRVPERPRS